MAPSVITVTSHLEVGGNKISHSLLNTNKFNPSVTTAPSTSGQRFFGLYIACGMTQGRELAFRWGQVWLRTDVQYNLHKQISPGTFWSDLVRYLWSKSIYHFPYFSCYSVQRKCHSEQIDSRNNITSRWVPASISALWLLSSVVKWY